MNFKIGDIVKLDQSRFLKQEKSGKEPLFVVEEIDGCMLICKCIRSGERAEIAGFCLEGFYSLPSKMFTHCSIKDKFRGVEII